MPKAIAITNDTIELVLRESEWPEAISEDLLPKPTHVYLQDVQFPHGFVDHCIVTVKTFEATFKQPNQPLIANKLVDVDYL